MCDAMDINYAVCGPASTDNQRYGLVNAIYPSCGDDFSVKFITDIHFAIGFQRFFIGA